MSSCLHDYRTDYPEALKKPNLAADFFESLFCPVPEQRLLPHRAQSHPYLKLAVDSMRYDQAQMGVYIVSRPETHIEVLFPTDCDSDDIWAIEFDAFVNRSALDEQLDEPTLHSRSRCKRHWWQIAKQRCAYGAAADGSHDNGQLEQIGHAGQRKTHRKHRLGWPRVFKPFGKAPKSGKVPPQATGTILTLQRAKPSHVTALGKLVQHLSMVPRSLQAASP